MSKVTITVNGKVYNAATGAAVTNNAGEQIIRPSTNRAVRSSHHAHRKTEKSRTAQRRAPSTPVHTVQKRAVTQRSPQSSQSKSPAVARFAPHAQTMHSKPRLVSDVIRPATPHPMAEKAHARIQAKQPQIHRTIKPAGVLKKEAIDEAMEKAPQHNGNKQIKRTSRAPRMLSFASMALSVLLLAGYFTYINLPNLSVRVAAAQAGIEASYPGYRPDGYRLAGVNYEKGSVSLDFSANAGPQSYTVTQRQTSWDSTAVRENYVKSTWGDNAMPYSERGLTIYAHEGNAAWVNGGIFYTITGDAPLSTSQVRSIAASL